MLGVSRRVSVSRHVSRQYLRVSRLVSVSDANVSVSVSVSTGNVSVSKAETAMRHHKNMILGMNSTCNSLSSLELKFRLKIGRKGMHCLKIVSRSRSRSSVSRSRLILKTTVLVSVSVSELIVSVSCITVSVSVSVSAETVSAPALTGNDPKFFDLPPCKREKGS